MSLRLYSISEVNYYTKKQKILDKMELSTILFFCYSLFLLFGVSL
jgi:hypothetical protein